MITMKTYINTRMTTATINYLLMIQLESPTVERYLLGDEITLRHSDPDRNNRSCYMDEKQDWINAEDITEDKIESDPKNELQIGSDPINQFFSELNGIVP